MIQILAVTVALAALPQQRTVFGEVRDTAGAPLADVEVVALNEARVTRTSGDGTFRLDRIPLGEQRFLFRHVGFYRIELAVIIRADAETVVTRLTPIAMVLDAVTVSARRTGVFGVVGDAEYKSVPGVEVNVIGGGRAVTDSGGGFNLPKVRSGTYMLRVRKRGYYPITRSLTIPKNEAMELSLLLMPLPRGLSSGRVSALSGYGARLGWALAESDSRQMRCRGGSSVLVTREELAEQGQGTLAEALPRTRSAGSKGYGRMDLLRYRVIVDGVDNPGPPGGGVPLDDFYPPDIGGWPLSGIAVEDVEAVEIYKGYPSFGRSYTRQLGFGTLTRRTTGGFGCPAATIWIWLR